MLFNLYIFRQLLKSTLALVVVLMSIIWLFHAIRALEFIVNRGAGASDFLIMSVASMPLWLIIAVPISGFIAINWVFNRILAERELLVMQTVGLSPMQLAKAPVALGIILTSFLSLNSAFILPTSFGVYKDLQFKLRNTIPTILLRDGVFIDVVNGMTMLIGRRDNNNVMHDVFIYDARINDRIITMTAKNAQFMDNTTTPTLVLHDGERSERNPTGKNGAVLLFETHSLKITRNTDAPAERTYVDMNEDSISDLLSLEKATSADNFTKRYAEGHYRIASPFLGLALCLLSASVILRGQIRRDLWSRRAVTNISGCIAVIIGVVLARSLTSNNSEMWPLIHASVIIPIAISIWIIRTPATSPMS
jgi:lipopolysaccharide export system permease protein